MDSIRSLVFGGSCRGSRVLALVARFTRRTTCLPKSSLGVKFSPNGGRWKLSSWSAVLTGVWLVGVGIAAAQEETIEVTAPESGAQILAGSEFSVEFDLAGGVSSTFDIDLYQGDTKVFSWCSESEGCQVHSGIVPVDASNNLVGEGYTVKVTERSTLISGSSGVFELLEPATPSPLSLSYADFQEVGGGGGSVGSMNLVMVLVASICGLALAAALIVACVKARGCRTARKPKDSVSRDLESGGLAKQHPGVNGEDFDSPGTDPKLDSLVKMTPSRGGDASQMRLHPRSLGVDAELEKYRNPGTALARGDNQRSRTVSKDSAMSMAEDQPYRGGRSLSRTPGRSMSRTPSRTPTRTPSNRTRSRTPNRTPSSRALSHTPNRTPGRYRGGPVMMGTNPGRSMMSLRRMNTGGDGDEYTSDASGNWDFSGPPRMLGAPPEWSRSPRSSGGMGGRAARGRALPRYADERELPPRGTSTPRRTRTADVADYRRSMSVGREGRNRYGDPEGDWEMEFQRRAMERRDLTTPSPEPRRPRGRKTRTEERDARMRGNYYEGPQRDGSLPWGHQDRGWSPSRHTPRRSGVSDWMPRKVRSNSDFSRFSPDYYGMGRSRFSPARAKSVGARSRQDSSSSPGRHGSHRGSMVDVNEQDVSWEELRSAHQRGRSRNRSHGPTARAARYSDADGVSSASGSSAARSGRARQYSDPNRLITPGGGPLYIGVPHEPEGHNFAKTSMSVRPATNAFYHPGYSGYSRRYDSRSHSSGGDRRSMSKSQSPASRAKTAREAAKEAQESAERALAAAAAASRAADAAAQAAIDAEAEVKATVQKEGGDDTPATSYSSPPADAPDPSSVSGGSVRDRVGVASDGNNSAGGSVGSRGASGSNGGKVLIGTKVKTKEALAVMGCSDDAESLRCANGGWLAPHRNGGQDTAVGSGEDRNSNVSESVIRDSGAVATGDDLASRRLAFVRQYSVSSTGEGDSEYSMYHENPAIIQVHAPAPAPVAVSAGMMRRAPYMSPGSGLTSFDESDLSFRDAQALDPPTLNPLPLRAEAPSSPLSHVPPSSIGGSIGDGVSSFVGITVRKRASPSRAPDFKRRLRKGGRKLDNNGAVINSSEAGSTHDGSAGY